VIEPQRHLLFWRRDLRATWLAAPDDPIALPQHAAYQLLVRELVSSQVQSKNGPYLLISRSLILLIEIIRRASPRGVHATITMCSARNPIVSNRFSP
jgi:hypothetical protein